MKNERKITLSEKDLLKFLAEKFNLNEKDAKLTVYKFDGGNDPREQSYTNITIIGTENEK